MGDVRTKIRDILGAFLFPGEDVGKKVSVLSGGERSRLAMIRLLLEPVNFLVLDEPTNHLDMRSKDILKQALAEFDGTILLVSHDREFLDGLVTCVYEFRNKKVKQHLGGIYDFLQRKRLDSLKALETKQQPVFTTPAVTPPAEEENKELSFEERKNINRNISRIEKGIEAVELEISNLEARIAEMDNLLTKPEMIDSGDFFGEYEAVKQKLAETLADWENQHLELEEWTSKKTW